MHHTGTNRISVLLTIICLLATNSPQADYVCFALLFDGETDIRVRCSLLGLFLCDIADSIIYERSQKEAKSIDSSQNWTTPRTTPPTGSRDRIEDSSNQIAA
jgi:hypothetical protein